MRKRIGKRFFLFLILISGMVVIVAGIFGFYQGKINGYASFLGNDLKRVFLSSDLEPPVADAGPDLEVEYETTFCVNGSASYSPNAGGSIVKYSWNFSDGSNLKIGSSVCHKYVNFDPLGLKYGFFPIILTVTDNFNMTANDTAYANVQRRAPRKPFTLGPAKTLVALFNFQDFPDDHRWTFEQINEFIFGPHAEPPDRGIIGFNGVLQEMSYGSHSLYGDIVGWYIINVTSSGDPDLIKVSADAALIAAGINLSDYSHLFYFIPKAGGLGRWKEGILPNNSGVWVLYKGINSIELHEFGHIYGPGGLLPHSSALKGATIGVDPVLLGSSLGTGAIFLEYGDLFDPMGSGRGVSYNAVHKDRMGWLNESTLGVVNASGVYTLTPFELSTPGWKAVKIQRQFDPKSGRKEWYYLECRRRIGLDSYSDQDYQQGLEGILVHWTAEFGPGFGGGGFNPYYSPYLLDMTPNNTAGINSNDFKNPSLLPGKTFEDIIAGIRIQTLAADDSGCIVDVSLNSALIEGTRRPPTVAVQRSPEASTGVPAGSSVSYQINITNRDDTTLPTSYFNINVAGLWGADLREDGWNFSWIPQFPLIAPGLMESVTLIVTSPLDASVSVYPLEITVSNQLSPVEFFFASTQYRVIGPDTTPPYIYLNTPRGNVSGIVGVSFLCTDNVRVTKAELYKNSLLFGSLTNISGNTCTFSWDTTLDENGVYSLQGKAYDAANNTDWSQIVNVTVINNLECNTNADSNCDGNVDDSEVQNYVIDYYTGDASIGEVSEAIAAYLE